MKYLRFQVCPNKLANAINFLFQTTSVAYAHIVNIFCYKSFVSVLFYCDYSSVLRSLTSVSSRQIPCTIYMAHQRRRSRHRRAHSCCRSWTNARKYSGHCRMIGTVHRLSSTGRAEPEDCHSASAGSSGTPNIRPSMTRFAR